MRKVLSQKFLLLKYHETNENRSRDQSANHAMLFAFNEGLLNLSWLRSSYQNVRYHLPEFVGLSLLSYMVDLEFTQRIEEDDESYKCLSEHEKVD